LQTQYRVRVIDRALGLAATVLAVACALLVQRGFPGLAHPADVPLRWGVAAAVGFLAWWLAGRVNRPARRAAPVAEATWRRRLLFAVLVPSALTWLLGIWLLLGNLASGAGGWLWLVGLVGVVAAVALCELPRLGGRWPTSRRDWVWRALVVALVVGSLAARVYKLDEIPAYVVEDEAEFGDAGWNLLHWQPSPGQHVNSPVSVFQTGWGENPYFSWVVQALTMDVAGHGLFGLRLSSAIFGALGIWVFYLLLREMTSRPAALLGATLLAVCHTHLFWTRAGMIQSEMLFLTTTMFLAVLRGYRTARYLWWVVAGVCFGVAQYVYLGARFLVPMLGVFIIYLAIRDRTFVRRQWGRVLALGVVFVAVFLPQGFWLIRHPQLLSGPGARSFIFSIPGYIEHTYPGEGVVGVILGQARRCITALAFTGDGTHAFYAQSIPIVDPIVGALFLLGIVGVTFSWRRPGYALVAMWFWLVVIMLGIPTIDTPGMSRLSVVLPAIFAMCAIAADRLGSAAIVAGGRTAPATVACIGLIAFGAAAFWNLRAFFVDFPRELPANHPILAARLMRELGPGYRTYVVSPPSLYIGNATIRVVARGLVGDDLASAVDIPVRQLDYRDANFVVFPGVEGAVERVRAVYPGHTLREHHNTRGQLLFYSYQVPADEVNRAAGPDAIWRFSDLKFGQRGSALGQLEAPLALAADAYGRLYVGDMGNHRIAVFDGAGKPLAAFGGPGPGDGTFGQLWDVAVAPDGSVLGLDRATRWVQRFDGTGKWLGKIGGPDVLKAPTGLAVLPDGDVIASDAGDNALVRMRMDGQVIDRVGGPGQGPGQLDKPGALAAGRDGTLFVLDVGNQRVQRFIGREPSGQWPAQLDPEARLAVADDGVYISANGQALRYRPDGAVDLRVTKRGDGRLDLTGPRGLAVTPAGDLYILDGQRHQIFLYRLSRSR
jgi:4-amino-4-deoxy-L-arabinose transferase-like glycosyltransferase